MQPLTQQIRAHVSIDELFEKLFISYVNGLRRNGGMRIFGMASTLCAISQMKKLYSQRRAIKILCLSFSYNKQALLIYKIRFRIYVSGVHIQLSDPVVFERWYVFLCIRENPRNVYAVDLESEHDSMAKKEDVQFGMNIISEFVHQKFVKNLLGDLCRLIWSWDFETACGDKIWSVVSW